MLPLHSIKIGLPYEDTPLYNTEIHRELTDRNNERQGIMHRMWIEDERVVGVWSPNRDNDEKYIIDLKDDYSITSRFTREDAEFINQHGTTYYMYTNHIMVMRGDTWRDILT